MAIHPANGQLLLRNLNELIGIGLYFIDRYEIASMNADKAVRREVVLDGRNGLTGNDLL